VVQYVMLVSFYYTIGLYLALALLVAVQGCFYFNLFQKWK